MNANKLIEPKWYAMTTVSAKFERCGLFLVAVSLSTCFAIYEINMYRIRNRYSIPVVIRKLRELEDGAVQVVTICHVCMAVLLIARFLIFVYER